MSDLVAVVLAGGSGTRFFPFTQDKLLFPFLGKPFVSHTPVFSLPKDVTRVVIIANERNKEWFESAPFSIPKTVVVQQESKGMADALLTAEKELQNVQLLILIADDLFDPNVLNEIIEKAKKSNAFGVLPGWKSHSYFPGGYLQLENEKIIGIQEKPGSGNEPSPYVNISGHYISNSTALFTAIHSTDRSTDDVYEAALSSLMSDHEFTFVPYEGSFCSLKYPWHVLSILDQLLLGVKPFRGNDVVIKDHVVIDGQVYIGNNVKIMEFTKIVGPCYIGDNTIVGNNNCIRQSYIGDNCVTGFNTDITRSYIGNSCWFHTNYIGDSVLEENVGMGSGTVLANLRLDEEEIFSLVKEKRTASGRTKLGAMIGRNVRIGVNTSTMPGIKIGADSSVGAGIVLSTDIPSGSFCKGSGTTHDILKNTKTVDPSARDKYKSKL